MSFKYKIAPLCLFLALGLNAQQELMQHSLTDLWHSTSLNPALFPEGKRLALGLPAFSLDAAHSGDLTYNDLLRKKGDRTVIDLSQAISRLDPENEAYFDQRTETVSLGLRSPGGKWAFQIGHAIQLNGQINYPKSLAEVLWNGNAPYIGETLQIGPQVDIFDWQELYFGVSRKIGRFSLGARVKYLMGVSALRSDADHTVMSIYTDPDIYQLTLTTDYAFYSSSIISAIDTAGLGFDFVTGSFGKSPSVDNPGVAFDLGFEARLSDNLSVNAAVLNLGGRITWKKDAQYYISQNAYTYEGADFPGTDLINGTDSLDFEGKLDTLNDIFQFAKQAQQFETTLPVRVVAGATFKLSERWHLGLNASYTDLEGRSSTAVGASLRWLPLRWLSLGAMYGANSRSAANFGFHLAVKPGPVQVYLLSDNLLNAFSLKSSPAVNLKLGAALVF
ncbi:MAG: hypothetical protein KDC70_06045 [Saprospiraceae bacterium]|nr:hypothetical protein [Saprospiraceae bacterium]